MTLKREESGWPGVDLVLWFDDKDDQMVAIDTRINFPLPAISLQRLEEFITLVRENNEEG
jgi:hypothetical protein